MTLVILVTLVTLVILVIVMVPYISFIINVIVLGRGAGGGTVGTAGLPQNSPFVCFESICCGAVHLFLCCGSSFPLFCKHLVTSGAVCATVAVLFWFVL